MNKTGLPDKRFLDSISFRSITFNKVLKNIHLSKISVQNISPDIDAYKEKLIKLGDMLDNYQPYRIKTYTSIARKLIKYQRIGGDFLLCFNDLIGFRIKLDKYPALSSIPKYFRVVDMRKGKRNDDGYRGIHLYYQRDPYSYPIEVQLWDKHDYIFNTWAHIYSYKATHTEIGRQLREAYDKGIIKSAEQFIYYMNKLMEVM